MANSSSQCTSPYGSITVFRYTILLDMTRALAHIGALPSLYKSHITLLRYQVFGAVPEEGFSVDIENSAIRYYSGIFSSHFILFMQVLIIWSLCL